MQTLWKDRNFIIKSTVKNLGPAIMATSSYIKQILPPGIPPNKRLKAALKYRSRLSNGYFRSNTQKHYLVQLSYYSTDSLHCTKYQSLLGPLLVLLISFLVVFSTCQIIQIKIYTPTGIVTTIKIFILSNIDDIPNTFPNENFKYWRLSLWLP